MPWMSKVPNYFAHTPTDTHITISKQMYLVDSPHASGLNSNVCIGGAAGVPNSATAAGGGGSSDGKSTDKPGSSNAGASYASAVKGDEPAGSSSSN